MGDPRKQRKKYESPRNPWSQEQIEAELQLIGEYGLRNKRELWRSRTALSRIRGIARSLLAKEESERTRLEKEFLESLSKQGILPEKATIDDVLDLDIKDILERRLQTITFRKGLAKSIQQARQLVAHGHIKLGTRSISIPGYLVSRVEEPNIRLAQEVSSRIPRESRASEPAAAQKPR
jgi:small subunit ribosomal protein S4